MPRRPLQPLITIASAQVQQWRSLQNYPFSTQAKARRLGAPKEAGRALLVGFFESGQSQVCKSRDLEALLGTVGFNEGRSNRTALAAWLVATGFCLVWWSSWCCSRSFTTQHRRPSQCLMPIQPSNPLQQHQLAPFL